jgi:hypothetical protein
MTTYSPFAPLPVPTAMLAWGTREYNQSPEAREFARALTAGTTTRADDVTVLWLGAHLALVKRKGGKGWVCRGQQGYYPARYEAVDRHRCSTFGLAVPDVFTGEVLLPPTWQTRENRPEGVQAFRSTASVPAALLGSPGSHTVTERLHDWVEKTLAPLDVRYMDLAEEARLKEKAKQEEEAAADRKAREERDRANRVAAAAPKLAEALRLCAGFTARVAQGHEIPRSETTVVGQAILAALKEAGVEAIIGETLIERLTEVGP